MGLTSCGQHLLKVEAELAGGRPPMRAHIFLVAKANPGVRAHEDGSCFGEAVRHNAYSYGSTKAILARRNSTTYNRRVICPDNCG